MIARTLLFLAVSPWTVLAAESNPPASEAAAEAPPALVIAAKFEIPVFEIVKLDQKPVVKFRAAPQYPAEMRKAEIEGEVLVDFVVTAEGNVVKASALRSSRREFEAAAVAAVSKWKFVPGKKSGRPVNTHMQVPIGFALN
jgi:periplasmic protein TonB